MTKQIKNLILFLILAFSSNAAFCYTLTSAELKEDIISKITPEIKSQLSSYSSDYKINVLGVPNNSIQTNEQIKPKIEVISQNNNFSSNQYRRILVKSSNGTIIKAFPITIQTQVYANVLVASRIINYNEEINSNNSKIQRKEISKYLGKTYSNLEENLIAKRNYQKDAVIIASYTKENSCVLKNSNIDIVFQSKNLNIKVRGKALKEGAMGDKILVRSDKYNKTYTGIIKSANEVVVRI